MSLQAQTIGQIFEIEFFHILQFWAFFTLESDPTYPNSIFMTWLYIGPMMKGLKVSNKWGPISISPIVNASRVLWDMSYIVILECFLQRASVLETFSNPEKWSQKQILKILWRSDHQKRRYEGLKMCEDAVFILWMWIIHLVKGQRTIRTKSIFTLWPWFWWP